MPRPFHFKLIGKLERHFEIFADHFIHDGAVVDAHDGSALARVVVEEKLAHLADVRNRDGLDAQQFLGQQEIGQRLLVQRVNLHQNHVTGIVVGDDGPPQQFLVALPIQSAHQVFQVGIQTENFPVGLR